MGTLRRRRACWSFPFRRLYLFFIILFSEVNAAKILNINNNNAISNVGNESQHPPNNIISMRNYSLNAFKVNPGQFHENKGKSKHEVERQASHGRRKIAPSSGSFGMFFNNTTRVKRQISKMSCDYEIDGECWKNLPNEVRYAIKLCFFSRKSTHTVCI